jgi:hypothetical protein
MITRVPIASQVQTLSNTWTQKSLAKENYNLVEEHNFFEKFKVDGD